METGKTTLMHSRDLTHSINNTKGKMTNNNLLIPDVPIHPGTVYRSPPKPIRHYTSIQGSQSSPGIEDINPSINFNFEKIHHFRRVLYQKCVKDQINHSFKNLKN